LLTDEDDLSILFSFTRAHFQVPVARPYDLVRFLRRLMPKKRLGELYNAVGLIRHGKTEPVPRDDAPHGRHDRALRHAPGTPGLVMIAFAMPGYDFVFKVIRDYFPAPKKTSRELIMERYTLVFKHDRAGRLVEAQQFEHLKFDKRRFTPELLAELVADATGMVLIGQDDVVLHHCYVERQVVPLDLFLRQASPPRPRRRCSITAKRSKTSPRATSFPATCCKKTLGSRVTAG